MNSDVKNQAAVEPTSLFARLWRELMQTPTFREAVRIQLRKADGARGAEEAVRAVFWSDADLSLGAATALPHGVNALAAALGELGRQMSTLPPDLRHKFLTDALSEIDREKLHEAAAAWRPLWRDAVRDRDFTNDARRAAAAANRLLQRAINFERERPGELQRLATPVAEFVAALDFGKLREATRVAADSGGAVAGGAIGAILANPAAMANTLGLAPPLVNAALRFMNKTLTDLEITPEVLASALFNVLANIDQAEVGRVLTLVGRRVNQLHAGNMILGGNQPQLVAVLRDLLANLGSTADWREITAALTALLEDFETIVQTGWEAAWRSPQAAAVTAAAAAASKTTLARTATDAIAALAELPEETFQQAMQSWRARSEPGDAARLADALMSLATRVIAGQEAARPEQLGRRANQWLVSFNRRQEKSPDAARQWLGRFFGEIHPAELERALRLTLNSFTGALFAGAGRGMAVLRPLMTAVRQGLSCWLSGARRRLFGKRAEA